jgi:hypothetical protein
VAVVAQLHLLLQKTAVVVAEHHMHILRDKVQQDKDIQEAPMTAVVEAGQDLVAVVLEVLVEQVQVHIPVRSLQVTVVVV